MTLRCVHISSVPERGCSQMNRGRTPLPYLLKWREDTFPLDEMGICSVLWGADLYRQWGSCQQPPQSQNRTGALALVCVLLPHSQEGWGLISAACLPLSLWPRPLSPSILFPPACLQREPKGGLLFTEFTFELPFLSTPSRLGSCMILLRNLEIMN